MKLNNYDRCIVWTRFSLGMLTLAALIVGIIFMLPPYTNEVTYEYVLPTKYPTRRPSPAPTNVPIPAFEHTDRPTGPPDAPTPLQTSESVTIFESLCSIEGGIWGRFDEVCFYNCDMYATCHIINNDDNFIDCEYVYSMLCADLMKVTYCEWSSEEAELISSFMFHDTVAGRYLISSVLNRTHPKCCMLKEEYGSLINGALKLVHRLSTESVKNAIFIHVEDQFMLSEVVRGLRKRGISKTRISTKYTPFKNELVVGIKNKRRK